MENPLTPIWQDMFNAKPIPRFLRDVKRLPFAELKARLDDQDVAFLTKLIASLYSGDAYIVESAFEPDFLRSIPPRLHEHGRVTAPRSSKILDGVPDYHEISP